MLVVSAKANAWATRLRARSLGTNDRDGSGGMTFVIGGWEYSVAGVGVES